MSELETTMTAAAELPPIEDEMRAACERAGIDFDPEAFPWKGVANIRKVWSRGLLKMMDSLLREADRSRNRWREIACHEAAALCWAELRRRGGTGLSGTKGAVDPEAQDAR